MKLISSNLKRNLADFVTIIGLENKRQMVVLQLLVIISSVLETINTLAIGPFLVFSMDDKQIQNAAVMENLKAMLGNINNQELLFNIGVVILFSLIVGNITALYVLYKSSKFGYEIGQDISRRLFIKYLNKPYMFHVNNNSSQLVARVQLESMRITNNVIQPFMLLNTRIFTVIFLTLGIIMINIYTGLIILLSLSFIYVMLYKVLRRNLSINGRQITESNAKRQTMLDEAMFSIKDIILKRCGNVIIRKFDSAGKVLTEAQSQSNFISKSPKYFIELITLSVIIILILSWLADGDNLSSNIAMVALYAIAGYKLLPAIQQIFSSVAVIKSNINAFEIIKPDFLDDHTTENTDEPKSNNKMEFSDSVTLDNVTFSIENQVILDSVNIRIKKNGITAFVGKTGSGKSTAANILMGLYKPTSGTIRIDSTAFHEIPDTFQNIIGFVPQNIFLLDDSIAANVAFYDEIDEERVKNACKMAHVDEFADSLPEKLNTPVGQNGAKLSGGQIQRIGIARALYRNPDIIIFDEATSALDNDTERLIMNTITELSSKKTMVIIAHRLTTIKQANAIYVLEKGRIADSGTYSELSSRNPMFQHYIEDSNGK